MANASTLLTRPPRTTPRTTGRLLSAGMFCLAALGLRPSAPAAAASGEERSPTAPVRFAFSSRMFVDVNENDARAAMKVWGQTVSVERGIPLDPVFQIFVGTGAIATAIRGRLVDAITLPTDEYWELRNEVPLGSIVIGSKGGESTEQYVLLVRGDSGIQRLADLRGHSLVIYQNPLTSLAPAWLETELLQHQLGLTEQFWGRITESAKLLRAILPVFFHQADACLVTLKGFETMAELNPQIGRQLQVLAKSEAVVPNLFCFRGDYRSPYREKILQEISRLGETTAGQQTLALFQTDRLFPGDPASLAGAFALLDLHRRLRAAALKAPPRDFAVPPEPAISGRN
jgi:ABC-type phosphate/phosphonate transport system substrate-binding protein